MTFNGTGVDMAFGHLIIPFLVTGPPDFPLAALAAGEGQIKVNVGKGAIGVDVREFAVVGGHGRGVVSLLGRSKAQNSFSFA